jgi:protein subunit release factor A
MNLAAGPEEVQAVLAEFLLPTVSEGILGAVEERSDLTNREKATQLKRLDAAIANAEQQAREEAKAAALAEVEARFAETAEQFGGVAA